MRDFAGHFADRMESIPGAVATGDWSASVLACTSVVKRYAATGTVALQSHNDPVATALGTDLILKIGHYSKKIALDSLGSLMLWWP